MSVATCIEARDNADSVMELQFTKHFCFFARNGGLPDTSSVTSAHLGALGVKRPLRFRETARCEEPYALPRLR